MKAIIGSMIVLVFVGGCNVLDKQVENAQEKASCVYKATSGFVTILSIESVDTNADGIDNPCPSPKKVTFRFDAGSGEQSQPVELESSGPSSGCLELASFSSSCVTIPQAKGNMIVIMGGFNPPEQWLSEMGIAIGSAHPAVKYTQTSGNCSPEYIRFSDLNFSRASDICMAQ